jgi:hypothetical protein
MKLWLRSWQLPTPAVTGSRHDFRRPYGWEEVPMFNARMNQAIGRGCNWNDGDVPYSELQTVLHRDVSSTVAIYCIASQKTNFISVLIDRRVIDICQLSCPKLADISLPAISCTCACHYKSKNVCALRTAFH